MEYKNAESITDQQLVDYILRMLPKDEEAIMTMYLHDSPRLQERLSGWESVLFQLNDNTGEIKPPKAVWRHIEKRLFEMRTTSSSQLRRKPAMFRYIMPAFLSLCVLFGVSYYFAHQPTYTANVVADNQAMWQIEGNDKSIRFTSLADVSMDGQQCVAWLVKPDGRSEKLGTVPDTGDKAHRRIALPESLSTSVGDKVIIAMVSNNYHGKKIPADAQSMSEVLLTGI